MRVRYFTAIIKVLPGADANSPKRQQAYISALETPPRTTVHLGKFRIDTRLMPCHPIEFLDDGQPKRVEVRKREEKGSDVALASHLILDASAGDSDIYVVLSNDSDPSYHCRSFESAWGARSDCSHQWSRSDRAMNSSRPVRYSTDMSPSRPSASASSRQP